MYNPVATYRIQLRKEFTLKHLDAIIPYLIKLGIKTVYASPLFSAVPESAHGYDGINPALINPEIGTEEELIRIHEKLKAAGIGWLQDIVPNHMAYHPDNEWLMDVLAKGKSSEYAGYFDILWDVESKLMAPFLGSSLEEAIEKQELKITLKNGQPFLQYFEAHYPLNAASFSTDESPEIVVARANEDAILLRQMLDQQHYRLCNWQETDRHINYRRFFTVNGLICLNIQDEKVFNRVHAYPKSLLEKGVFSGLRIDHIDGLYDPQKYLEDLRALTGEETYIVVEKILEPGEELPETWPIQGNTGYDFLALVNNLFTNRKSESAFNKFYDKLVKSDVSVLKQIHKKKAHILEEHMQGEQENLYQLFLSSALAATPAAGLKEAIGAFLVHCPVYRYYGNELPLNETEATAIRKVLKNIKSVHPALEDAVEQLKNVLLEQPAEGDEAYNKRALHFYQRCMQFTGPLMAKGVEDTLMYTYNRFIGHNDVGDAPEAFGLSAKEFHEQMEARQAKWPLSINGTSTHDTKRGEDARARLNVLTDVPKEWFDAVRYWQKLNAGFKTKGAPDANDEYFLYQTLVATYPFPGEAMDTYAERITEYLTKALREAKTHSGWAAPDEAYEEATKNFLSQLLDESNPFLESFATFQQEVMDYGIINSLAQLLLKFTCPGVPDVYQGTELWDLSLVDPDNRRPVDYDQRLASLDLKKTPEDLWNSRYDATIKLSLTQRLLQARSAQPELFTQGQYIPLEVTGKYSDHVFAFARKAGRDWILAAVPLHLPQLCKQQDCAPLEIDWKHTAIQLPKDAPNQWRSLLNDSNGTQQESILVKDLFATLPLALLQLSNPQNDRRAGILMPVTALPSPYGIGDFGPQAKDFITALSRSGQGYWQLLPINPSSEESGYSPYSSVSTMAGNTLLISPDLLAEQGLLDAEILNEYQLPQKEKVDYATAEKAKQALLDKAFQAYSEGSYPAISKGILAFQAKEKHWLDDYALYTVIRKENDQKPWYEWPEELKQRDSEALEAFRKDHEAAINKVIWLQYIFSKQWKSLKEYGNSLGIKLMGDLPFYASYDSADVWTHPDIFSLDKNGKMTGIAGVPPDYFSETGQLWGMPTFKWEVLKAQDYEWWIARLRKNLELYDVLRIDHFRALAGYWEVPAGEETAVNGQWLPGPGKEFFEAVKEALGSLPFIAEDLGDNMDDVYKLRNEIDLPGMKVVQFAFGENLPVSVDIPHNYPQNCVAYTGTHDNNTSLGWYREDAGKENIKRLEKYTGYKISEKNVTETLARLAYASVARIAILPMQDVLKLNEEARMNMPSSASGNWGWRLLPDQFSAKEEGWLLDLTRFYNRL